MSGLVVVILLAGCASLKNTPEQDLMWEIGHVCEGNMYQVTRVQPDGAYTVQGASNVITFQPFFDCVRKEVAGRQAKYAKAPPRELVATAYFTDKPPAPGPWKEYPPRVATFKRAGPVTFFYGVSKSGRELRAKFRWLRPDGTLEWQSDSPLRDARTTGLWTWYVSELPSARAQYPGTWRLEFHVDDQLVGTYEFTIL